MNAMMTQNESGILQTHTEAVGTKAGGYMWATWISQVLLNLKRFNGVVRSVAQGDPVASQVEAELRQLQSDTQALRSAGAAARDIEECTRMIALLQEEVQILRRLDATARDSQRALGDAFEATIESLHIRDLSPRHAFRTATRKLEVNHETKGVNYLIRMVSDNGEFQERHIVKEIKDPEGRVLEYHSAARLIYRDEVDADGDRIAEIKSVVLIDEPYVREACAKVEEIYKREISGASGTRFGTALKHLTNALQSIPLTSRGRVYYCGIAKAPVVSFIRELVRWVDFRFRTPGSEGCQFLALPLMGSSEMTAEVVQAANAHLQMKLAEVITAIQAIRKERQEITEEDSKVRAELEAELDRREKKLREEVLELRGNVSACLEGLVHETNVLQQGSKILLTEYAKLMGL